MNDLDTMALSETCSSRAALLPVGGITLNGYTLYHQPRRGTRKEVVSVFCTSLGLRSNDPSHI